MKIIILLFAVFVFSSSCESKQPTKTITNNHSVAISDVVIVVDRSEVANLIGSIPASTVIKVTEMNGIVLPSQCDDLDGDGVWDELAFLINLKANESNKVSFSSSKVEDMPIFNKRTNIRFGRKFEPYEEVTTDLRLKSNDSPSITEIYQMEGPAWENDKVAFRNYYDARNGIDIFGKQSTQMVLDSVGIRNHNYHKLDWWGMDILKVANSLGAGSIALSIGDSSYRIGPGSEGTYRFITEGPVRAMFDLGFNDMHIGERNYNIKHRISIYAGDGFYRSQVWIDGCKGDEQLVTGIVNKHELLLFTSEQDNYKLFATIGNQAFEGETLGLGIMIADSELVNQKVSPMEGDGITETYLMYLKLNKSVPATFYFYSGWQRQNEQLTDSSAFIDELKASALKLQVESLNK